MIKKFTLVTALVGSISTANGHDVVSPNLRLRGSSSSNTDADLPRFFPTNMNQDDMDLYFSHHKKKTSPIIEVNKDDWLSQCAATIEEYYNPEIWGIPRSNFYLIDEPSGLCADALVCAFDKCMADTDSLICLNNQTDLSSAEYDDVASTCNLPNSWLPGSIMFPKNAADVISAIKYAKNHYLQISIKSTGHSYFAAHTKAGSLMLNMRDYAKYASGNDKIIECDTDSSADDELGDACTLATARKKDAYIRVGGGQTWSEVYNAVNASNAVGNLSKTYGIAGGAAGSVGAAGGWLSGGGLSIGYEREHGLGVDQILEFEVALPSGHHVRVFPTEWEDDKDDFITPQTTKVTALCNTNIVANEDDWDWEPCTDLDVSPEDLWMALRGGGGGTYGITLSVKYQLFNQNPLQWIELGLGFMSYGNQTGALDDKTKEVYETIVAKFKAEKTGQLWEEARRTFTLFIVDFLFAPEKIGVSKEISLSCGSPATMFSFAGVTNLVCWGNESAFPEMSSAWNRTINGSELAKKDPELADLLSSKYIVFDMSSFGFGPYSSYGEYAKMGMKLMFGKSYDDIFPIGVVPDSPLPMLTPTKDGMTYCSINLPFALLETDDESERELLFKVLETSGGEHTTGGYVSRLGDGMDSVSPSERSSGQSSIGIQSTIDKYGDDILNDYLAAVYKYTGDEVDGFPGFSEYNHFCSEASTVSKTNWTESCDPKDDDCFSAQQLVWGEDLYAKLQDIKAAVDPDNLLDCYQCVKPSDK